MLKQGRGLQSQRVSETNVICYIPSFIFLYARSSHYSSPFLSSKFLFPQHTLLTKKEKKKETAEL